jgi:hypothetical protein
MLGATVDVFRLFPIAPGLPAAEVAAFSSARVTGRDGPARLGRAQRRDARTAALAGRRHA